MTQRSQNQEEGRNDELKTENGKKKVEMKNTEMRNMSHQYGVSSIGQAMADGREDGSHGQPMKDLPVPHTVATTGIDDDD